MVYFPVTLFGCNLDVLPPIYFIYHPFRYSRSILLSFLDPHTNLTTFNLQCIYTLLNNVSLLDFCLHILDYLLRILMLPLIMGYIILPHTFTTCFHYILLWYPLPHYGYLLFPPEYYSKLRLLFWPPFLLVFGPWSLISN